MIVNNNNYYTNLANLNKMRYILFTNFFNRNECIQELTGYISTNIDNLSIDYDAIQYQFIIKIKKTGMRKIRGFHHASEFYYNQIIPNIFRSFIQNHHTELCSFFGGTIPEEVYTNLSNFCHVSCLADNILVIKL